MLYHPWVDMGAMLTNYQLPWEGGHHIVKSKLNMMMMIYSQKCYHFFVHLLLLLNVEVMILQSVAHERAAAMTLFHPDMYYWCITASEHHIGLWFIVYLPINV